jgi:hypothetical protein
VEVERARTFTWFIQEISLRCGARESTEGSHVGTGEGGSARGIGDAEAAEAPIVPSKVGVKCERTRHQILVTGVVFK